VASAGEPSSPLDASLFCSRLLGVLMRGMTYDGKRWRLATVGDWNLSRPHLPQPEHVQRLQGLRHLLFALYAGESLAA